MYGQGRVLGFNKNGIPIGQVLLPGRDEGHNLQSTNMAIRPDTKDLYLCPRSIEPRNLNLSSTISRAFAGGPSSSLYPSRHPSRAPRTVVYVQSRQPDPAALEPGRRSNMLFYSSLR